MNRWPIPPTSFVGRVEELAALDRDVRTHRLVTVLGPPGIGKTRLVLEWLRRVAVGGAQTGIRFCELGAATSVEDVVRCVATAFGVAPGTSVEESIARIGALLANGSSNLLVLDPFEHVLDVAHPLLATWRRAAPQAHVLVTSRERLRLEGEAVFEPGPLVAGPENDDGVRLFVERAREVRSGYELAPSDVGIVRELVDALDRHPLAIELAAARMRVLTPKEILARMGKRFELLVTERRGRPRESTLLDAIEGSFDRLPPWGRAALLDSAVFEGGFDLASAELVLDLSEFPDAPPIVDVLEALCDKSLVAVRGQADAFGAQRHAPAARRPDGMASRFQLHANIRAFAAERLEASGRREAVRARHARRYALASRAWGQELLGSNAPRALDHMRPDAENLTAALRHLVAGEPEPAAADRGLAIALSLASLLDADGACALRAWALEASIAFASRTKPDPSLLAKALDASVLALVAVGRSAESRANAERACGLANSLSASLRGRTLGTLGLSFAMEGRVADATSSIDAAIALLREAGDRFHEGRALGRLAWLEWMTGQVEAARDHFLAAIALHRAVGDVTFEAMNGGYLAVVMHELGELESPRSLLEQAIAKQRGSGHRRVEADLTLALGLLAHERGALDDARSLQRQALAIHREIGHFRDQATILADLGKVELDAGDLEAARAAYGEALSIAHTTSNPLTVSYAEAGLGIVAAREGRIEDARRHFDRADADAVPGPRGTELVDVMRGHLDLAEARAAFDDGNVDATNQHLAAARDRFSRARTSAGGGRVRCRERRLALAALSRAIDEATSLSPRILRDEDEGSQRPPTSADARPMTVQATRRVLQTPDGHLIELERHPVLWRLVECFVDVHRTSTGRSIGVEELVAKGWPDERVRPDAGARRVYTALSTLRHRGLRAWLVKRDDGYSLAADLRVVVEH